MAGTLRLNTVGGWVTYLNTKAGIETGIHNITKNSAEIEAYANGDGSSVILPYCMENSITLPTKEDDGLTNTIKTFTFYNMKRMRMNVTYSGTANA